MEPKLTLKYIEEISENSSLKCDFVKNTIQGILGFSCFYDSDSKEIVYSTNHPDLIVDEYEVLIDFNKRDIFGLPKVYELSNKIREFAESKGINSWDIHINPDNSFCLGIFPIYKWTSAYDFIIKNVIPFFYWQSHYRIFGVKPWGELSHGNLGLLERLTVAIDSIEDSSLRNKPCLCGSNKKYKNCCLKKDRAIREFLIK
jgi:hypothetical protein